MGYVAENVELYEPQDMAAVQISGQRCWRSSPGEPATGPSQHPPRLTRRIRTV